MEYNTVYNIGDEVWFMYDNKVCVGKIEYIRYSRFVSPSYHKVYTTEKYRVRGVHELFDEERFFESKEDLLASL